MGYNTACDVLRCDRMGWDGVACDGFCVSDLTTYLYKPQVALEKAPTQQLEHKHLFNTVLLLTREYIYIYIYES